MADTHPMSGLVGWMRTAPICPASYSPMNCQVAPPSSDRYTPRPVETLLRTPSDPVPTQMMSGLVSATAMEPMDATGTLPSVMGCQLAPASVVRHTPPLATPM